MSYVVVCCTLHHHQDIHPSEGKMARRDEVLTQHFYPGPSIHLSTLFLEYSPLVPYRHILSQKMT